MSLDQTREDLMVLGVPAYNSVTGLLGLNGVPLVEAHVATTADLIALSTTTYNNQSVMVDNPAGNVSGWGTVPGIPARTYCYNGAWHWENGCIILGIYSEALQLTVPAATFTGVTIVQGVGPYTTKCALSSAGVHGLTNANSVMIPCKVRVSGTNLPLSDIQILDVDTTATLITIDLPWVAATYSNATVVTAGATEVEIARCKIPVPLTTRARVELDGSIYSPVSLAGAFQTKFYLGASGAAYGASTNLWTHNLASSVNIDSIHFGFALQNSRAIQKTIFYTTNNAVGYGSSTSGDATSAAVDMTAVTDLFVTTIFTTANRPMRYDGFIWKMYDA